MTKVLNEVLAANARYAGDFGDKSELPIPPGRRFAILTCMDARLDPAKFAGLAEGDAHVIRNAGGRASDDAIRSLVISYKLLGTREWFVVHHTNCGMETFTDEIMRGLLASSLETATIDKRGWRDTGRGPGSSEARYIDWLTIDDNARSVVEDVARIRSHPLVNKSIPIYGYIYDVKSGRLIEVPEASAVGGGAPAATAQVDQGGQSLGPKGGKPPRRSSAAAKGRKARQSGRRRLRPKRGSPGKRPKPLRREGGSPAKPRQPDCACVQAVPSGIIPLHYGAPATRGPWRENHPRRMLSKRLHARTFITRRRQRHRSPTR